MDTLARFAEVLKDRLASGVDLSPQQIDLLYAHYTLLRRWNEVLNLTAIRNLEDAIVRHYCESIFLAAKLPADTRSVLDIGSGAGFPGIPVAVVRPECRVTLAESRRRKAVFLREVTRGWPNVRVYAGRAESLVGESFDWSITRAVHWKEVVPTAARLSRHLSLLLGDEDAREAMKVASVRWNPLVPLPWGERRVLLTGSFVSDGA